MLLENKNEENGGHEWSSSSMSLIHEAVPPPKKGRKSGDEEPGRTAIQLLSLSLSLKYILCQRDQFLCFQVQNQHEEVQCHLHPKCLNEEELALTITDPDNNNNESDDEGGCCGDTRSIYKKRGVFDRIQGMQ